MKTRNEATGVQLWTFSNVKMLRKQGFVSNHGGTFCLNGRPQVFTMGFIMTQDARPVTTLDKSYSYI